MEQNLVLFTAWKVSKYGVFSGPYFPVFGHFSGSGCYFKVFYDMVLHVSLDTSNLCGFLSLNFEGLVCNRALTMTSEWSDLMSDE